MKYIILVFGLLFIVNKSNAQNKPVVTNLDLISNKDDAVIPDKLQIEYSFSNLNDSMYKVRISVRSFYMQLENLKKDYEFKIKTDDIDKNFKKDVIGKNIIYFFYLDEKKYLNFNDVKKAINKIFELAIDELKREVILKESNKEVDGL